MGYKTAYNRGYPSPYSSLEVVGGSIFNNIVTFGGVALTFGGIAITFTV